jgi:hypothetical protein
MNRFLAIVLLTAATASATAVSSVSTPTTTTVTFNKDVLPVLQDNCQVCHRSGGIAPMSFMTYESTRPFAKAIKAAVVSKKMPPWFADPHYGNFRNAPKLTQANINTLTAWADNGALEGDSAVKPADRQWKDGWRIQPDVVVAMQEPYRVAAKGAGEIKEFIIPNPFKEDTWVTSVEIRPGDPSVVHHVIMQVPQAGLVRRLVAPNPDVRGTQAAGAKSLVLNSDVRDDPTPGPLQNGGYFGQSAKLQERITGRGVFMTMEAVYAPGTSPIDFRYTGSAKLIPGGKPIRLEVHYTPNGKETLDKTMVGFTLAKTPAQRRFVLMAPEHLVDVRKPIPAGAANWETTGELTFDQDAELVWFMPHMHLRGKDMTFRLIYPDGKEATVLNAKFNFHWQLGYEVQTPIRVPKGTRMVVTAHHDNSAANPSNPVPDQIVPWGDLTSQEMMLPWFGVVVNRDAKPESIASYRPGDFDGPISARKAIAPEDLRLNPPPPPGPATIQRAIIRK